MAVPLVRLIRLLNMRTVVVFPAHWGLKAEHLSFMDVDG